MVKTVVFGEYHWKSYRELVDDSHAFAKYLFKHDLTPKESFPEGEFHLVAIYAKNREEWTVTDVAAFRSNVTVVTLYDTLGKSSIEYILDQTKLRTVCCGGDKVKVLLQLKQGEKVPKLEYIITYDPVEEA